MKCVNLSERHKTIQFVEPGEEEAEGRAQGGLQHPHEGQWRDGFGQHPQAQGEIAGLSCAGPGAGGPS